MVRMRAFWERCRVRCAGTWCAGSLGGARGFRFVSEELASTFLATLDEPEQSRVREASRVELPAISVARLDDDAALRCRASRGAAPIPLWVACGRLIDVKRVDRAIREAARHGARLAVVGDGPLRAELEALADSFSRARSSSAR